MHRGWIKIWRNVWDSGNWYANRRGAKASRFEAWVDLLMMANHAPREQYINGKRVLIERGCLSASIRFLAKRWRWSVGRTRRFLNDNDLKQKCTQQQVQGQTHLTICNYETYQGQRNTDASGDGHTNGHSSGTNTIMKELKKEGGATTSPGKPSTDTDNINALETAYRERFSGSTWRQGSMRSKLRQQFNDALKRGCKVKDIINEMDVAIKAGNLAPKPWELTDPVDPHKGKPERPEPRF